MKIIKKIYKIFFVIYIFSCSQNIFARERFYFDYLSENYKFNLPLKYNSCDHGLVTSIKSQNISGMCWAFAIISVLESSYLKQNNFKINYKWQPDFSEMNLIYNLNSGASINNPGEFDLNLSGNSDMATAYFSSGRGPVLEQEDKYNANFKTRDHKENLSKQADKYIREIIYVPDIDKFDAISINNHRELVKKFVFENASVATSFYLDENFFDKSQVNYFYNSYASQTNHMGAIVGWDDNYPKENFNSQPENDGAFIIKNSWGKNKNSNGYFYMSYEDKFAGFGAYVMREIVNQEKKYSQENIYQNDLFGMTDIINSKELGDKNLICCMFDLKNSREVLSDIGIFIASNNTNCKFFLINHDASEYSEMICERDFKFPGYYVISLSNKILLTQDLNKKFGIAVKMTGQNLFVPCAKAKYNYCSKLIIDPEKNLIGDKYGLEKFTQGNFCIKAFTEQDKNLYELKIPVFKKFHDKPIIPQENNNTQIINSHEIIYIKHHPNNLKHLHKFAMLIICLPLIGLFFAGFLKKQ